MDATVPFRLRIVAEALNCDLAHPGHDSHVENDVNGIGDFEADFGQGRIRRAHYVRHDEQGAAAHRAFKHSLKFRVGLGRIAPVVGRTGFLFSRCANESELLDPGDVVRVGAM